jgi:hypothetical protein
MKYIKLLLLFCLISFSQTTLAKTETDTITNWQIYKDSTLLFRSSEVDCYKLTGVIKKKDDFKSLKIIFFRDTKSYGNQKKIKLLNNKIVVAEFDYDNSDELEIIKRKIHSLFKETIVSLEIIYFDRIENEGILLGYLRLEN